MSKQQNELRLYANEQLMDEFNNLMIRIKVHLFDLEKLKGHHRKPTNEELDNLFLRIISKLKEDSIPMRRY